MQIVKIDFTRTMRQAGEVDDARSIAAPQRRQQMRRQRIMAEIIGAELHLEAIGGHLPLLVELQEPPSDRRRLTP